MKLALASVVMNTIAVTLNYIEGNYLVVVGCSVCLLVSLGLVLSYTRSPS